MKIHFLFIPVLFSTFRTSLADFDCEKHTNKTAQCREELLCSYIEEFKMRPDTSYYCRCKMVIISALALPENRLGYGNLSKICSQNEDKLQELWINDADLEYLDDEIFEKFKNLHHVNLAGNNIMLNFTENAQNKIEVLNLNDNKLNSVDSYSFENLPHLRILDLSFNRLDVVDFIASNVNLEEIYLNDNHISSVDTSQFHDLCKLRILNLAHNHLRSFERLFVCSLEELYMDNNELRDANFEVYAEYPLIFKKIYLNNNKILKITNQSNINDAVDLKLSNNLLTKIEKNSFIKGNQIRSLDLESNNLSDIHASNFQNFENVSTLIFKNNSLTEDVINCDNLQHLVNVTVLSLSHNQISQIYDCNFRKLQKLTNLSLAANQIETIPPSTFKQLRKLQELDLSMNKIREIPVGLFDNLVNLKKLNLSYNRIKYFDVNSLNRTGKLSEFDISRNDITDLDLRLLIEKLPSLKLVDFDKNLVKCEIYSDVLQYFDDNSIVMKSCVTREGCCKESKLFIILAISVAVLVLVIVLLCCVLCYVCYYKRFRTRTVTINK